MISENYYLDLHFLVIHTGIIISAKTFQTLYESEILNMNNYNKFSKGLSL